MRRLLYAATIASLLAVTLVAQNRPGQFSTLVVTNGASMFSATVQGDAAVGGTTTTGGITVTGSGSIAGITAPGFTVNAAGTSLAATATVSTIAGQARFSSTATIAQHLNFGYLTNGFVTGAINSVGYLDGTTQFRDLSIQDGKGAQIGLFSNAATSDKGLFMTDSVNVGTAIPIGRATTNPTGAVNIANGTAPVGTATGLVTLYATAGELRVMDAGGVATLLSPHDHATGKWIYDSTDSRTGRHIRVDIEDLAKFLDRQFGTTFVHETGPPVPYPRAHPAKRRHP